MALDREWYDQEEGGAQIDETHNPFLGDENLFAKKEAEMQQKMKRRDGSNMTLAQSKRANELQKDMNAWEENRMLTSGVVRMREVRFDSATCSETSSCWPTLHAPGFLLSPEAGPKHMPRHSAQHVRWLKGLNLVVYFDMRGFPAIVRTASHVGAGNSVNCSSHEPSCKGQVRVCTTL